MLGSDSGLPLHTRAHTHTHLRTSWAGSSPTVRLSHIKEPGVLWHCRVGCPFFTKDKQAKSSGCGPEAPLTRCWNGDLAVWHVWSTCVKKLCCLFVFLRHRQSLVLSPSQDTFFINRPQMWTTKQQFVGLARQLRTFGSRAALVSEVHGKN